MACVWSRQQVVQRTFGTTVTVKNEESTCECNEWNKQRAHFDTHLSHSYVSCTPTRLMSRPIFASTVIHARTFSHNGRESEVVRQVFGLFSKRVQV